MSEVAADLLLLSVHECRDIVSARRLAAKNEGVRQCFQAIRSTADRGESSVIVHVQGYDKALWDDVLAVILAQGFIATFNVTSMAAGFMGGGGGGSCVVGMGGGGGGGMSGARD